MQNNINYTTPSNVGFTAELAEAEAALLQAEETLGKDHIQVSHKLDRVAEILRKNKIRTIDAVNMEARARVIRIGHNQTNSQTTTEKDKAIDNALKTVAHRQKRQRTTKFWTKAAAILILGLLTAQLVYRPTPDEQKAIKACLKITQKLNLSTLLKNYIDTSTDKVKQAAAKEKEHNKQLEEMSNAP